MGIFPYCWKAPRENHEKQMKFWKLFQEWDFNDNVCCLFEGSESAYLLWLWKRKGKSSARDAPTAHGSASTSRGCKRLKEWGCTCNTVKMGNKMTSPSGHIMPSLVFWMSNSWVIRQTKFWEI